MEQLIIRHHISNNVKWEKNENIPLIIDNSFKRASEIRFNFIEYNNRKKASTVIDANYKPNSTLEVLSYLPRALFVGVFSPFPNTWNKITSILHLLISLESIIWYLMILGIFFIKKIIFKPRSHWFDYILLISNYDFFLCYSKFR